MLVQLVFFSSFQCGVFFFRLQSSLVIINRFGGMLIQKMYFQLKFFVSQFFRVGLMEGVKVVVMVNSVMFFGWWCFGNLIRVRVNVSGISVLLVKFCMVWNMIMFFRFQVNEQSSEDIRKFIEIIIVRCCVESSCISQVVIGIMMIFVIRQEVEIYEFFLRVVVSVFWMFFSEELVIWMLSIVMNVLSMVLSIVIQLCWVGLLSGWVSVLVVMEFDFGFDGYVGVDVVM